MALSENSVPSKACCIRGYDSRYVSEVCFGGMFRGMFRPPLLKSWVWFVVWFAGMIRGHDSGYDSRKCNMHVIINFVYAISGNTHIYVFTNNNTKHWCKCFDTLSNKLWKQYPPKTGTISEPSTSSFSSPATESRGLMRFPHQYPPPRPRPWRLSFASTAAFASRSRWTTESWPWMAAMCSGVLPQEPRPEGSHGQNPTERRGEKFGEKFGCLKSRSFGNFGHSKILPELREQCGFEDVLMTSSWLKKAMWTRLAVKMICGNLKKCSISKKTNMRAIGTQPNLNSVPYSIIGISCNHVRGLTHIWTGKT